MSTAIYEQLAELIMTASEAEPSAPIPSRPLALGLATHWSPQLLVVGGGLAYGDHAKLVEHGCRIESARTFSAALQKMHIARWDVVVVGATVDDEGDGVRFVRSFKRLDPTILPASVSDLVPRFRHIPFVILPLSGTTEYAIFQTASDWLLQDANRIQVADAILRLESWS